MVAVFPPRFAGVPGDLPPLHDPEWDPFWASCNETMLPVHIHAGHGAEQGKFKDKVQAILERARLTGLDADFAEVFEGLPSERRPLWQLMWGGVFDRFPNLRVVFAEVRGDWVPATLEYLDRRYEETGRPMRMRPSEYWAKHCLVGASFMRRSDLSVRKEVGVDRMMFGTDYPHIEGTWPNTLPYLRIVLDDVNEDDARRILGENAVDTYGLDREYLRGLAARVGFMPSDVLGRAANVDPRLVEYFVSHNGLAKSAKLDLEFVADSLAEDIAYAAH